MIARRRLLAACIFAGSALVLGCDEHASIGSPNSSSPTTNPSVADEQPRISLTAKAAATLRRIVGDDPKTSNCVLRIRVIPGGCQGFMHKLDLDPHTSDEDYFCESRGIKIVLFKRQLELLRGAEIDYGTMEGMEGEGFKIENPNFKGELAKRSLALLQKEKDNKQ
jgi:iron-sulfur cluster assembly protein